MVERGSVAKAEADNLGSPGVPRQTLDANPLSHIDITTEPRIPRSPETDPDPDGSGHQE